MRKKILLVLAVVFIVGMGWWWRSQAQELNVGDDTKVAGTTSETKPPKPAFDKTKYSLTDPDSPWVIVNKQNPLPDDYRPDDLTVPNMTLQTGTGSESMWVRRLTARALGEMSKAAAKDGARLMLISGFRSQAYQNTVYRAYVARDGRKAADTYSARPGYSEHQTGWSLDLGQASGKCAVAECFGSTKEGRWLAKHAHEYGFIVRYGKNKQKLTGYQYEPWHLRYVGKPLARQLHKTKQTLEQFFDLPAARKY